MCCREGLDKPPKPSTRSSTIQTSTQRQQTKQTNLAASKIAPPTVFVMQRAKIQDREFSDIETVDLAGGEQHSKPSNHAPLKQKSLHGLHSREQSATPPGVTARKRPTFSYAKGTRPNLSFLDAPQKTTNSTRHVLDEWDDEGWMDDLPSPSALIGRKPHAASSLTFELPRDNGDSRYDDSLSELEACMVGLDDSVVLEDSKTDKATEGWPSASNSCVLKDELDEDLATKWSSSPNPNNHTTHLLTKIHAMGRHSARSKGQSIFMSTDSPEKPGSPCLKDVNPVKRPIATPIKSARLYNDAPRAKKRKTSVDCGSHALHLAPSTNEGESGDRENPIEKIQKLGWEGIDPYLIAEYGDIVEFVEFD